MKRRSHIQIHSEGQRLLLDRLLAETPTQVAELVGVDVRRIDEWRSGRVPPSGENARLLADTLGIPVESWTRVPGVEVPERRPTVAEKKQPTSLDEVDRMLTELRETSYGLTEKERAKRSAERIQLLRLKSQIEHRQALTEDAIVRAHPHWKRVKEALRTALAKHPEALADIVAELNAIGEWDAARSALIEDDDDAEDDDE